jgi:predicted negative regulator of RcsB-dependent stress response
MNKVVHELYGIDTKKLKDWLKRNGVLISVVGIIAFSLGYHKGQTNIMLDCKYAKAVRIDTEAYECRRIM